MKYHHFKQDRILQNCKQFVTIKYFSIAFLPKSRGFAFKSYYNYYKLAFNKCMDVISEFYIGPLRSTKYLVQNINLNFEKTKKTIQTKNIVR